MSDLILSHLSADPAMARVIRETIDKPDFRQGNSDVYYDLLVSIISQQLSGKVAQVISGRFMALFSNQYPEPEDVLAMEFEQLRAVGLSNSKTHYIRNVAEFFSSPEPPEIDLEKLINDPLYLDNQAHAVVSRMRDMDSGTKSQLRRFYNAVRRACRAPEADRQHEFVMLRARLAYTIARHSLRSLDLLERLLLQVTRRNDIRGYERFRDLFEAIVAYNE